MLCQYCGKNPASVTVGGLSGGIHSEIALCTECARKLGFVNLFAEVFSFYKNEESKKEDTQRCKCCGASFSDILKWQKVGCPECYHTFYERLLPLIRQIHGSAFHRGKKPGGPLTQSGGVGKLRVVRKTRHTDASKHPGG